MNVLQNGKFPVALYRTFSLDNITTDQFWMEYDGQTKCRSLYSNTTCPAANKSARVICIGPSDFRCPFDWHDLDDNCYYIGNTKTNHTGAAIQCKSFNATLLEITSHIENRFIKNVINKSHTYWIANNSTSPYCELNQDKCPDFQSINATGNWTDAATSASHHIVCKKKNSECSTGKYGENCRETCDQCSEQACDRFNGHCSISCAEGWKNFPLCDQECDDKKFGMHCEKDCHCENGEICDKRNGHCPSGVCSPGYDATSDPSCQKEITTTAVTVISDSQPAVTTERYNKLLRNNSNVYITVTAICCGLSILFAGAYLRLKCKMRRSSKSTDRTTQMIPTASSPDPLYCEITDQSHPPLLSVFRSSSTNNVPNISGENSAIPEYLEVLPALPGHLQMSAPNLLDSYTIQQKATPVPMEQSAYLEPSIVTTHPGYMTMGGSTVKSK